MTVAADPLLPLVELPGVAEAAANARTAIDRLLSHRVLRRSSAVVSAEAALRGARASAALEGVAYQLEAVRSGAVDDPVVQGALRVSSELGRHVGTWRTSPLQVLARLHALAAAGLTDDDRLGRPRPGTAAGRLGQLATTVLAARDPRVPAVVEAAVVHGELASLRPFGTADGVVARAAARLTLITRGLDPKAVSVPEAGHVELGGAYDESLAAYAAGTGDGLATWLRHCAEALVLGAREGTAICEAVLRG